jgi:hypothetical protein
MTRLLRATALTLLCGLALLLGSGVAAAHTRLVSSDPADGSTRDTGPTTVSLVFNEAMEPGFSTVTVIGPDGRDYRTGDVRADGGTVTVDVAPLGPAGRYEIGYRVISADGHPVTGSVSFTTTTTSTAGGGAAAATGGPSAAPAAAPAAVPAPAPAGGTPVWPWVLGAVVLVGGGVAAALRLGRG